MNEPTHVGGQATALLGREVVVTLAHPQDGNPQVIVTGTLLGWGEGGDVQVRDEAGFVHHAWPMLDITEVASCEGCNVLVGVDASCPVHGEPAARQGSE